MPASKSLLQIAGVSGDSKDSKHCGWIDLLGWNFEPSGHVQGSNGGQGRELDPLKELSFMIRTGAVSMSLRKAMEQGTKFDEVILEVLKDGRLVQRIRLGNVYVTGAVSQVTRGEALTTISLSFGWLKVNFGEETPKENAPHRASWDIFPSHSPAYGL